MADLNINREFILREALKIVNGDREQSYGNAEDNFDRIADLWRAYLHAKIPQHYVNLTGIDVANMMILLKLARTITGTGKMDNWIDIAGYAACGGAVEQNKKAAVKKEDE